MAKAESEAPRGDEFYRNLAEALKQNDVAHWAHLLEVDPISLKSLDSAGKVSARRAVIAGLAGAVWQVGCVKALARAAGEQKGPGQGQLAPVAGDLSRLGEALRSAREPTAKRAAIGPAIRQAAMLRREGVARPHASPDFKARSLRARPRGAPRWRARGAFLPFWASGKAPGAEAHPSEAGVQEGLLPFNQWRPAFDARATAAAIWADQPSSMSPRCHKQHVVQVNRAAQTWGEGLPRSAVAAHDAAEWGKSEWPSKGDRKGKRGNPAAPRTPEKRVKPPRGEFGVAGGLRMPTALAPPARHRASAERNDWAPDAAVLRLFGQRGVNYSMGLELLGIAVDMSSFRHILANAALEIFSNSRGAEQAVARGSACHFDRACLVHGAWALAADCLGIRVGPSGAFGVEYRRSAIAGSAETRGEMSDASVFGHWLRVCDLRRQPLAFYVKFAAYLKSQDLQFASALFRVSGAFANYCGRDWASRRGTQAFASFSPADAVAAIRIAAAAVGAARPGEFDTKHKHVNASLAIFEVAARRGLARAALLQRGAEAEVEGLEPSAAGPAAVSAEPGGDDRRGLLAAFGAALMPLAGELRRLPVRTRQEDTALLFIAAGGGGSEGQGGLQEHLSSSETWWLVSRNTLRIACSSGQRPHWRAISGSSEGTREDPCGLRNDTGLKRGSLPSDSASAGVSAQSGWAAGHWQDM
ncbi:unnamed protein product [Prorocentrum cordatum]|uniref:Uncharacterized protein n=1 Tax=Prorocentrum cordatum TaxID=2364126 RepID=A0ABN9UWU4_9DINO|nr:unnamed protein product [Polarella glacialis]